MQNGDHDEWGNRVVKDDPKTGAEASEEQDWLEGPIHIPIEDSLDLHTFRPSEVEPLLDDYLTAACEKGFTQVRIIHGKGTGRLRRRVHTILGNHPLVSAFEQPVDSRGGWGATEVRLIRDCSAALDAHPDSPDQNAEARGEEH